MSEEKRKELLQHTRNILLHITSGGKELYHTVSAHLSSCCTEMGIELTPEENHKKIIEVCDRIIGDATLEHLADECEKHYSSSELKKLSEMYTRAKIKKYRDPSPHNPVINNLSFVHQVVNGVCIVLPSSKK